MAKLKNQFSIKGNFLATLEDRFEMYNKMILQKDLKKKMESVMELAYRYARTPRAMMTNKYGHRVSNPNAPYGVPVRTGNLQASIKKSKIRVEDETVSGSIYVDKKLAPYAIFVEVGTSRMRPRPFMRPVVNIIKEITKDLFRKPVHK
jgi:HK97 gp10 family phage protein